MLSQTPCVAMGLSSWLQELTAPIAEGVEFQWLPAGAWQGRRTALLPQQDEDAYLPSTISGLCIQYTCCAACHGEILSQG